jgi:phosphomannomutase
LIATHSGLRGRRGVELTPDVVARTVGGLVELMRGRGLPPTLGVARDGGPDSDALAVQAIEAALARGIDTIDFGVVSTPAAKLASRARGLGGAVIATGSHLAPELTGLKLVAGPSYGPIDVGQLPEPATPVPAEDRGRPARDETAAEEHVAAICASVDVDLIRASGLAIGCEGGAGPAGGLLLERLGCENGRRPDLSLRLDADGDRLQLVDERGTELDAELTLPLALLALEPSGVVKGSDTSRMVDTLAGARGATVRTVPPGEIHLVGELAVSGGELAGEGNGGVVVPSVGLARDGLATAAAIIGLVARLRRPLSAVAAELPSYARRRSTVPCPDVPGGRDCLEAAAQRLGVEAGDPRVGVQVESGNSAWGLVRLSATEPVLRVTAEAQTQAEADALHAELEAALVV